MTIITMTREMGTRGKDVAGQVALKLGLELVHHELIESHSDKQTAAGQSEVRRFLEPGGAQNEARQPPKAATNSLPPRSSDA